MVYILQGQMALLAVIKYVSLALKFLLNSDFYVYLQPRLIMIDVN